MQTYSVTLTLKQLATLRLMVRLQKIRALRLGLQKYRAGTLHEHEAVGEILQKEDLLHMLDLALMLAETNEVQVQEERCGHLHPEAPVNLELPSTALDLARVIIAERYSPWSQLGGAADQAAVMKNIQAEQEGIQVAFQTASVPQELVPLFQQQPREKQ